MTEECSFCGESFDTEKDLHRHWDEHRDELNSHQKDKVKKAKRKHEADKDAKMAKRKRLAGYGLAGVIAIAFVGIVGAQLLGGNGGSGDGELGIDLGDEPMQGNPDANVTVVEFGDYRCPVCKTFHEETYNRPGNQPDLLNQYIETGRIKFYFVSYSFLDSNFPGDSSQTATVASECAYQQGNDQFWQLHNAIYRNQGSESEDWATEDFVLNLYNESVENGDYSEFAQCVNNRETMSQVNSDRNKASQAGVTATPTVFVNGDRVRNWGYGSLSAKIEEELNS
jgi:protein-disulfide isomerase